MNEQVKSRPQELRERTKEFAIRVVRLFRALPKTDEARVLGKQVLRSGTSVAANYRAVCRARSRAEFLSKIGVVLEEADETEFWLELLVDVGIVESQKMKSLLTEAGELIRIFSASQQTSRKRRAKQSPNRSIAQSPIGPITQSPDHPITQ
jgi:four helix bundle protein